MASRTATPRKLGLAHQPGWLARFLSDPGGNVGVMFGVTLTPALFMAAAAIDYSGASDRHAVLRRATDASTLKLCQMQTTATDAQLRSAADQSMAGLMGSIPYTISNLSVTSNPRQISLDTSATYDTAFIKMVSGDFSQVPLAAHAQCDNPQQTLEIALVLDNTGSMANASGGTSKMDALKASATNFVKFIFSTPKLSQAKIALVPFSAGVAVNPTTYRNASWIDISGKASSHWNFVSGVTAANASSTYGVKNRFDVFNAMKGVNARWDWAGCLESLPYPFNVQDGAPTVSNPDSYYVPMLAADESGDGGQVSHRDQYGNTIVSANSYIDDASGSSCPSTNDEPTRTARPCKYMAMSNAKTSNGSIATGPNFSCTTRPLTRLTNNQSLLLQEISAMQPTGNTDIHEGFMWGWRTVSPNSVFSDGVAYNTPYNNKIIVLMTDGMNTWTSNPNNTLKSYYSAYGYFSNPDGSKPNAKLPPGNANPGSDTQARAAMDALTLEACKNAGASNNVQVYTIGFSVQSDPIDQQGINMLAQCAGASSRAFVANDAKGLTAAFQAIADGVGQLRLTN